MKILFTKYHGTGNDFVMIDDRENRFDTHAHDLIKSLCDRRFGIGADGLILIRLLDGYDFEMVYFNADGHQTSMCGNGGRCAVAFAHEVGLIKEKAFFKAIDGDHQASISDQIVSLGMNSVAKWREENGAYIMDTGSPHYVSTGDLGEGFIEAAHTIRHSEPFAKEGINVNFVQWGSEIHSRTFERGVEGETYSCGTGAVAIALAAALQGYESPVTIHTRGGQLTVSWLRSAQGAFEEIYLSGPAQKVFDGIWQD